VRGDLHTACRVGAPHRLHAPLERVHPAVRAKTLGAEGVRAVEQDALRADYVVKADGAAAWGAASRGEEGMGQGGGEGRCHEGQVRWQETGRQEVCAQD